MNMVVVQHPESSGRYLFRVPEYMGLEPGTLVVCETCRGEQPGVCVTSSFQACPEDICKLWNTKPANMKRIIACMVRTELEWPVEPVKSDPDDSDAES